MNFWEFWRYVILGERPRCAHVWIQAGETGRTASEYDKHYWCTICGVLRHDTGWGPVKSTYRHPAIDS